MVEIRCKTNLDAFKRVEWPTQAVAVPQNGEYVRGACGKELYVVQVTHGIDSGIRRPVVYVELHAPPGMESHYMRMGR